jgi:hypothetical protein
VDPAAAAATNPAATARSLHSSSSSTRGSSSGTPCVRGSSSPSLHGRRRRRSHRRPGSQWPHVHHGVAAHKLTHLQTQILRNRFFSHFIDSRVGNQVFSNYGINCTQTCTAPPPRERRAQARARLLLLHLHLHLLLLLLLRRRLLPLRAWLRARKQGAARAWGSASRRSSPPSPRRPPRRSGTRCMCKQRLGKQDITSHFIRCKG